MASRNDKNPTLTHKIQTGGEITVNLVLTIKLESDGLSIAAAPARSKKHIKEIIIEEPDEDEDDLVDLVIPDIKTEKIIQFGEKVE